MRIYNREWVEALQIGNLLTIVECVAKASLMREESRGAMYRRDFPYTDNGEWLKNIIITKENGALCLRTNEVKSARVTLPKKGRIPYMVPEWEWSHHGGAGKTGQSVLEG